MFTIKKIKRCKGNPTWISEFLLSCSIEFVQWQCKSREDLENNLDRIVDVFQKSKMRVRNAYQHINSFYRIERDGDCINIYSVISDKLVYTIQAEEGGD